MKKLQISICYLILGAFACSKEASSPPVKQAPPVFTLTTEDGGVYKSGEPAVLSLRFDSSDTIVHGDLGFETVAGENSIGLGVEFDTLADLSTLELPDENETQVVMIQAGEETSFRSGTIEIVLEDGKLRGSLDVTGESASQALRASFEGKLVVACYFPAGDDESAGVSGAGVTWVGDSSRGPCLDVMSELGL